MESALDPIAGDFFPNKPSQSYFHVPYIDFHGLLHHTSLGPMDGVG